MRTHIKRQLISLLDSLRQLQNELPMIVNKEQLIQMLADCQEAAVVIGEVLERDSEVNEPIITLLENYCEEVYCMSELQENKIGQDKILLLNKYTDKVRNLLLNTFSPYHVIFMPYKASMWDSLESIWRACMADKRCECYVMPIPYYEFDSINNTWKYIYDGELFPEEVPIIHYNDYSLEENRPDVAYIHNPYDNLNLVTRVDPRYYSRELKRFVNKLVYVPYYVTSGFIAQEHLALSVYQHMDYMIVQSKYAKSFCKGLYYYDKILPFGSPKLDGVIKLCKEGASVPELWKPLLEGKKVLMLNTSIGCFLQEGKVYFQKIKSLCKLIHSRKQVALIWRPHPLLESAIKSMRPYLLSEFNDLKEYFLENKIGVFDETPDISRTVAISDGYIGEEGSSVINLFGAAGKPIFILNNHIVDVFTTEEKCRVHISDMIKKEDKIWLTTNRYNALFYMCTSSRRVHYVGSAETQPKWYSTYPFFSRAENKLFLSPNIAELPAVYDINSKEFACIEEKCWKESAMRGKNIFYKNRVFYLPFIDEYIAEFNTETGEWKYHKECIQELSQGVSKENIIRQGMTINGVICGMDIWITAAYTNRILRFNLEDGSYTLCSVGSKESGYSGIVVEARCIWLTEVTSGDIVRWDRRSGKVKTLCMPDGFMPWPSTMGRNLSHLSLINMGEWLVTIPGYSNCMVKLNKTSGKATLLIKDFWEKTAEKANGYNSKFFLSSDFGAKIDEKSIIVQRNWDDAAAIVNVKDETYEMFYPALNEEDFSKLTEGEDGFEKMDKKSGFFRRESKIFSFEGFMEDLIHDRLKDVRKRQLEELSTLAANLDGTCGIKVHEYMMNVLENNE